MPEETMDRAKRAAAGARTLAGIALVIVVTTVAISFGVSAYRTAAGVGAGAGVLDYVRALAPGLIAAAPAVLFISALAQLRRALDEFEAGRFFSAASSRAVRLAGQDAAWALAAQIIITPTLIGLVRRDGNFDLNFEIADLALMAFLVFVAVTGRALEIAAAVQAENDQIV